MVALAPNRGSCKKVRGKIVRTTGTCPDHQWVGRMEFLGWTDCGKGKKSIDSNIHVLKELRVDILAKNHPADLGAMI